MAIVKALRRLAAGGFGAIAATDQIQCDASAMTVTEPGKASKAVPDALASKADLTGGYFSGPVTATYFSASRDANNGGVNLTRAAAYTGYVEFYGPGTVSRTGYIGLAGADGIIAIQSEISGGYYNFNVAPKVNYQTIWHAGNLTGQVVLSLIAAYAPTIGQFLRALEASGSGRVSTVSAAIPADPGDTTNIAWNHATFVLQPGTLAQFVKTTLSLTDAQLAAIISNAKSVVE